MNDWLTEFEADVKRSALKPADISNHFPPSIRDALVAASQVWNQPGDPMARLRAINHATELAQARYPELFRNDI